MTTERMKKVEFLVLDKDLDEVLVHLGTKARFQFDFQGAGVDGSSSPRPSDSAVDRPGEGDGAEGIEEGLRAALAWLGWKGRPKLEGASLPGGDDAERAKRILSAVNGLKARESAAAAKAEALRQALDEARAFQRLRVPFTDLEQLTFITFRLGRIERGREESLRKELGERAIILPLDDSGRIAAASSRKGRFSLETALKNASFVPMAPPEGLTGMPDEVMAALEKEAATLEEERARLADEKAALASSAVDELEELLASFVLRYEVDALKQRLESTESAWRIRGWVPATEVHALAEALGTKSRGLLAARAYEPEELESVKAGREGVPVALRHGKFVSSFEGLVFSYGVPVYGSVDPTPLVAFFFVLLFSLMFGDVGQGLLIFLAGILLSADKKGRFGSFGKFAPILVAVGLGSAFMGLLEGSVFTNEELLVGPTRALTGALFGRPMDRVISLIPTEGMGRIFAFFGFTLAVGIILNSIGLLVNMWNLFRRKRWGRLLFTKTGLAGALFFWWAVSLGVRLLLRQELHWWDFAALGLPMAAILLGEPLERAIEGHKPIFPEGFASFLIKGVVEVLESLSYYTSNTVSFLRVGAFALSHAVLSFITFTMAELVRKGLPAAGPLAQALVLILGNAIILVLEGLVVTIQVVRLQYYEFFSKFFTETGTPFVPFRFGSDGAGKERA